MSHQTRSAGSGSSRPAGYRFVIAGVAPPVALPYTAPVMVALFLPLSGHAPTPAETIRTSAYRRETAAEAGVVETEPVAAREPFTA